MNKLLKDLSVVLGVLVIFIGGSYIYFYIVFDRIFTGPSYNKQDLINNYEKKQSEILEVKAFIDSKIPSDTFVHIEFDNDKLAIFHEKKMATMKVIGIWILIQIKLIHF